MNLNSPNPEGYWPANEQLKWNQSFYFNFYDPKFKIGGFIRVGILENINEVNTWCVFFMDGKPLFTRSNMNLPYISGRMDTGMDLAGMRITSIEPMQKARVEVSAIDFSADFYIEQSCPMEDSIAMSAADGAAFSKDIAHLHMEGPSHVTGTVNIRDIGCVEIDCTGFRDVAVGVRNWDGLRHYRMAWPVFSNAITVNAIHGITMTGADTYMRMLHDGRQWLPIKAVEEKLEFAEDDMTVKSAKWKVWDVNDKVVEFTGVPLFSWFFPMDTFVVLEQMMEFRLSDGTIGYGLAECGYRFPWGGNGC